MDPKCGTTTGVTVWVPEELEGKVFYPTVGKDDAYEQCAKFIKKSGLLSEEDQEKLNCPKCAGQDGCSLDEFACWKIEGTHWQDLRDDYSNALPIPFWHDLDGPYKFEIFVGCTSCTFAGKKCADVASMLGMTTEGLRAVFNSANNEAFSSNAR